MAKVKPLTKRTMTLNELQLRVLDVLRKVKFQFGTYPFGSSRLTTIS